MTDGDELAVLLEHLAQVHGIPLEPGGTINPVPITLSNLRKLHHRFVKATNNPEGCDYL